MDRPMWASGNVDIERPSVARIYDYHLGGAHNFAIDRAVGERLEQMMPDLRFILRANRAFLGRAVRFLADAGVRQFLDLGSGIPTVGNVHEVAAPVVHDPRVIYVDIDPVAVAHSRSLLQGNDGAGVLQADLRDVPKVLNDPQVRRLINFAEPVAALFVSVLHFLPDSDDPAGIVGRYAEAFCPGSYVVLTHADAATLAPPQASEAASRYSSTVAQIRPRPREQVAAMLNGLELVEPGLVSPCEWRPDPGDLSETGANSSISTGFAAIGRKP